MTTENVAISRDWWRAGWDHVMPRQCFPLHMLVATASVYDLDGSLDDLLDDQFEGEFDMLCGGLDAPIVWAWPDREDVDDPEQEAIDADRQERFETAMTKAGRPLPATVRELADLMIDLGIFEREVTDVERWRSAEPLPLPGEMLPLEPDYVAELDAMRWQNTAYPYGQEIIRHVVVDLGSPPQVSTSVDRLARATELEPDAVRQGLTVLIGEGDFRVLRDTVDVDPETLSGHARFVLLPDWDSFAETRIEIRRGR